MIGHYSIIVITIFNFRQKVQPPLLTIIRNRHPELVSGSMGYPKSEMLKKFQHDSDIPKGSIFDYGLWS